MASEQEIAEVEEHLAGEIEAIAGDVQKMVQEAVAAKEAENLALRNQLSEVRKEGGTLGLAALKRRLGIF